MKPRPLAAILLLLALAPPARAEGTVGERGSLWEWTGVSRVVAVGDLHGAHEKLVKLLAAAGLVDGELAWIGGSAHLVVAGDFLDRGSGDLEIVELLQRLEGEARAAGGRVHALLGNHEVMNLMRDTRYVHPETYRRLARQESRRERAAAWTAFWATRKGRLDVGAARLDFQRRFPRGYFARQRLFGHDGRYGRWLLGLPTVIKLDGMVYLHGGLTAHFASLGVDEINRKILSTLERHVEARDVLEREGIVGPAMQFAEARDAVLAHQEGRPNVRLPGIDEWAQAFLDTSAEEILGADGPLWYRGNSVEDERIEVGRLERSLDLLDARAMVVAHSFTGGNRITSRFAGRLFRLDHGIFESRRPLALVVEGGEALVLDSSSGLVMRPIRELPVGSRRVGEPPPTEEETVRLLAEGVVVDTREIGRGSTRPRLVVLERNGFRGRGVFKSVEAPAEGAAPADRFEHEVAAYRLDRRLGLGLVPATVVRRLGDEDGSLQYWIEGAVDREAAQVHGLELAKSSKTTRRLALGRLFDALIGNAEREDSDVLCEVRGDGVFLIDHSEAFPVSHDLPETVDPSAAIDPPLEAALLGLDRAWARRELGELLSEAQIEALLARRDLLLERRVATAARSGQAVRTGPGPD
ncbi:MAG: metallophosphoesterase [Thermoanaerobaculia bacterium]|nr:metallophosphoesterase [Thermoanaerobaculia bacterium]